MRLSLPSPISLSLLLFAQLATAQNADDFFNGGAQFYISNNIPAALEKVESGRKIYSSDVKLQKLEELLKQQQQQQQNQQNKQNQQQQSQQDQQSKSDQQKQDQQKKDQQQKEQQSQADKQNQKKPEQKESEPQQVAAGQMTPEEAKKLLDAQKGDEKVLQFKPDGKPQNMNRPVKDW